MNLLISLLSLCEEVLVLYWGHSESSYHSLIDTQIEFPFSSCTTNSRLRNLRSSGHGFRILDGRLSIHINLEPSPVHQMVLRSVRARLFIFIYFRYTRLVKCLFSPIDLNRVLVCVLFVILVP